jgi:hypothetical protein
LPELLAGLSDAADYAAVLAAIMATAGGRRFLTEFANRNRNADTAMVVGAIARVEAAIRGEAAPQAAAATAGAGAGELVEIAAALDRIAAAIAAGAPRVSDTAAAVERIQDIAFMLHERPLEATLRDSFDAAVRELAIAAARPDSGADAVDLVHALARRVREMIDARMSHQPAAEPFAVSPDGGEALAQVVTAFAATLPELAEIPDAAAEAPVDAATAPLVDEQKSEPEPPPPQHAEAAAPAAEPASAEAAAMPIDVAQQTPAAEVKVAEVDAAAPPQPTELEILDSASILSQAFADDHFAGAPVTAEAAPVSEAQPTEQAVRDEPLRPEPSSEAQLPAQDATAEPVANPEEDLADLFAPEPMPPPAAPSIEAAAPVAAEPLQSEPERAVPPPPLRAIPRPPLSDPLAAVRELSEEELIALFS